MGTLSWIVIGLASSAPTSDVVDDVTLALLRGDTSRAAARAAQAPTPAARARLLEALLQAPQRAAALLSVVQAFPDDDEADRALVAGAAAALAGARRSPWDSTPELAAWDSFEDDHEYDPEALAPTVVGLLEALAARRAAGGDTELLDEAERLLSLARVTRFGLWPVRVPLDAPWQKLRELREPLLLSLTPCQPGPLEWRQVDTLGAPTWNATLTSTLELPTLPAGDWLLEARSTTSPWRGVRRVLVSDLEAVALTQDGWTALAAFGPRGAVAATWDLQRGGERIGRGELSAQPALVRLQTNLDPSASLGELRLSTEHGTAWLGLNGEDSVAFEPARWLAHVMLDRALYRPGELVQGRVVLRTCSWDGENLARVPTTAAAAQIRASLQVSSSSLGTLALALHTDEHGYAPFSFVAPEEAGPGEHFAFTIELPELDAAGAPLRLNKGDLCSIANFRRQAVELAIEAPESVAAGAEHVEVGLRARLASGGPAAHLDTTAEVWADRDPAERRRFALQTDDDGRASVRVALGGSAPRRIVVEFKVLGPDGKELREQHALDIERADESTEHLTAPGWLQRSTPEVELASAIVDAPCRITLRGAAGMQVLVVVGRSANARVRSVQLGPDGVAVLEETVRRNDWPRLDVAVATRAGSSDTSTPVRLRGPTPVRIETPMQAAPGQTTTLRAHCGAPDTLVTFAVVDERMYALAPDRTNDPDDAFRPRLPRSSWSHAATLGSSTPTELLDSLLLYGRIPQLDWTQDLSFETRAAGGGGAAAASAPEVRSRFLPTAHFTTVVADSAGVATTHFQLPHDVTRWRVTAVVIAPDGSGAIERTSFASTQPLSAEPVMPRVVRVGDAFELPVSIDRAADAQGPDSGALRTSVQGSALAVERESTALDVRAGQSATAQVPMRAIAAGDASLQLALELGEHADRSERPLHVAPDSVARSLSAVASGTGAVTLELPADASPEAPVTLDVLQGGAEAWRLLEAELANYPYGCAEQTLARLLPRFAWIRAARARDETPPEIDAEFAKRLRVGLARLQTLQSGGSGQFAFWPGERPHPGITGLVLHGLAVLRDGGFDLERSGLALSHRSGDMALPSLDATQDSATRFVLAAEQLAGALRLFPHHTTARARLQPAVERVTELPAGLCARMGLALLGAGDERGARACRLRLQDASLPTLAPDGFPGEDPLAIQALRLELDLALGVSAADTERGAAELLLAMLSGSGSTYGRACALTVLASALPRTGTHSGALVVEAGGERREYSIGGGPGAALRCRVPHASSMTVRGAADRPLLVRLTTERSERASDHAAWAAPIQVERELCVARADATDEERREGLDLTPQRGPLQVGQPLVLRLVLRSSVPMKHVVVDCPLPAGFELPHEPSSIERFDDRVAFVCDLEANKRTELRLEVVPTLTGRFVWPPSVATPMYCSGSDGGTSGRFVDVHAAPSSSQPATATCAPFEPRVQAAQAPDAFEDWLDAFDAALDAEREPSLELFGWVFEGQNDAPKWSKSGATEETRARIVTALLAHPPAASNDPWPQLEALENFLWRLEEPGAECAWPERAWRAAAYARIQALALELVTRVLDAPHFAAPVELCERAEVIGYTLEHCPPTALREELVARWWRHARSCAFAEFQLLDLTPVKPTNQALRAALLELATLATGEEFWRAWELLDDAQRESLPPELVLDAEDHEVPGVFAWLAKHPASCAVLERRLASPEFVLTRFEALDRELPDELWTRVPLGVFAALAWPAVDGGLGSRAERVVGRLADAKIAEDTLRRELATAASPAWRFVLASALRVRRVSATAAATDTALSADWSLALDLDPRDSGCALALLEDWRQRSESREFSEELDLLARFVTPAIVQHGTPRELYAAREWLWSDEWRLAWARLDSHQRVELLAEFKSWCSADFVPDTTAEAEALWRLLLRSGDFDALDALLHSCVGAEFVRQRLHANAGGEHAAQIRARFARSFRLDEKSLRPALGDEDVALLARLAYTGFEGAWSAEERARLARLRLYRGL